MVLTFKNVCIASSAAFRYGGISVGGQLPVLTLQPQTIQDVAAQLGQILNVTGVWCHHLMCSYYLKALVLYLHCDSVTRHCNSGPRVNTPDKP